MLFILKYLYKKYIIIKSNNYIIRDSMIKIKAKLNISTKNYISNNIKEIYLGNKLSKST